MTPTHRSAALALLAFAAPLLAQPGDTPVSPASQKQPAAQTGGESPTAHPREPVQFVSIDFAGGTVGDYIRALRKAAHPAPVNVVLSEDARQIALSSIRLDHVTIGTALSAIEPASSVQNRWKISESGGDSGALPAWSVRCFVSSPFSAPDSRPRLEVMSIQDLITPDPGVPGDQPYPPETVLSAVDAALKTLPDADSPTPAVVKFHADSGILFVNGTEAQTKAVKDVLGRLHENRSRTMQMQMESSRSDQYAKLRLQRDAMAAAQLLDNAGRVVEARERDLQAVVQMREKGAASEQQINAARDAVMEAENQARLAEVQARGLRMGIRELGGSVVGPGSLIVSIAGEAGQRNLKLIEALRDAVNDTDRFSVSPDSKDSAKITGDPRLLQLIIAVLPPDSAHPAEQDRPQASPPQARPGRGGKPAK